MLLLLGAVAEGGILYVDIEGDSSVSSVPAWDLASETEDPHRISGVDDREMAGFAELSHGAESLSSAGLFDSSSFSTPAHVEIVGMAKHLPPCDPCRSGLLRPPQHFA